ncbi:probable disease resistance protein At5g63020 [Telopea speciosissima]|uniref:probable disease resistance protein At5g63020 n=1 Tax=Telopea speciosissima TaxID=54955 RepID=UPI001CC6B61D|nr:probable disease resistance protein At5g63020 [Telopea speciosissima]
MDFISPIIGWISPYVIDPIRARFRVLRKVRENIEELEKTAEKLDARRNDERKKLEELKKQEGVEESADANRWFNQANKAVSDTNSLRTEYDEQQRRGLCSNWSCLSRYQLSKRALKLKQNVDKLYEEDPKSGWTAASTSQKGMKLDTVSMEGQTTRETLKHEIIKGVLDDRYVVVGLHGMGGIGKTTLLRHVHEHFVKTKHFDSVIFTTVSATPDFDGIRKQIAKSLGFENCVDDNDVKERLSRAKMKFILILDDMWETIDLSEICIRAPTKENGCKILMASRLLPVIMRFVIRFTERDSLHTIRVDSLPSHEAWNLFVKKVGETLITSKPGIEALAKKVL